MKTLVTILLLVGVIADLGKDLLAKKKEWTPDKISKEDWGL